MESSQSSSSVDVPVTCTEEQLHHLKEQQLQGEEQGQGQGQGGGAKEKEKECVHRTKVIQFLGRTTPIVLQNDNGPCPLLAICNVLLLKNSLNLSPDVAEVSQEKLLSLVAEQLIDSNSNINNKDAGYIENQQQNIADAIDLLPRLATGIDVNIKFKRIDDFEFTSECAIFDLLDIPLYHGWIVDSQDAAAANAIGFKSYNALMADLVGLETFAMEKMPSPISEEETVDFAAATTAALGVPSPSLSKVRSFDTPPQSVPDCDLRKGDQEEEAELMRALRLSEAEMLSSMGDSVPVGHECGKSVSAADTTEKVSLTNTVGALQYCGNELPSDTISGPTSAGTAVATSCTLIPEIVVTDYHGPLEGLQPGGVSPSIDVSILADQRTVNAIGAISISVAQQDNLMSEELDRVSHKSEMFEKPPLSLHSPGEATDSYCRHDPENVSCFSARPPPSFSGSRSDNMLCASVIDGSEPIYEGEECILASGTSCDNKEPIYEGEVVLAKQSDDHSGCNLEVGAEDKITPQQGEIIKNFLRNSASQLTIYGLFSLQEGLKEREICVFFRNNHFSTMFKYEGELYLLATDQGYLNQPDLVWEKLNEVNGNTLFVTSNFKEIKMESPSGETWDEHNAIASTADYLASVDGSTHVGLDMNSDLQLAIALQQQEFEQQQQQQQQQPQQRNSVQQSSLGGSRLVTGPQVGRYAGKNPPSSSRVDSKSKDRCSIM